MRCCISIGYLPCMLVMARAKVLIWIQCVSAPQVKQSETILLLCPMDDDFCNKDTNLIKLKAEQLLEYWSVRFLTIWLLGDLLSITIIVDTASLKTNRWNWTPAWWGVAQIYDSGCLIASFSKMTDVTWCREPRVSFSVRKKSPDKLQLGRVSSERQPDAKWTLPP